MLLCMESVYVVGGWNVSRRDVLGWLLFMHGYEVYPFIFQPNALLD